MNNFDNIITMIQKAVEKKYRYSVPRIGQVISVDDSDQKGRIKVICESLGWTSDDQGVWIYPKGIRNYIIPKVDDYVIIEWIDGNRDMPCVYSSIAYWMSDMKPSNYDNVSTTQLIFEDNNQEMSIVYDELNKLLSMTYKKDSTEMYIKMDITNKQILINDSKNSITMDGSAGTIELENQSGKKIELGTSTIDIAAATESFIKGDTICTAFTNLCSTISGAASGTTAQNASGIETIKTAFATFNSQINNFKSSIIKGE